MTLPATIPPKSVAVGKLGFAPANAAELMQMAKFIAESDLKPSGLKTPADVFLVMSVGMSWGFDPMMALQTLHVVKGKVGLPGETCAALIQSHPQCADYRWGFEGAGDDYHAWVQTARAGRPAANPRSTFSVGDAKRAGLWMSKTRNGEPTPWCTYPDDMLVWKAVAREKRRNWPDIYPGLRVTEDMQYAPERERNVTPRVPVTDPLLASVFDAEIAAPSAPAEGPSGSGSEDSETHDGAASDSVAPATDGTASPAGAAESGSAYDSDGVCTMCDRHEEFVAEHGHAKGCEYGGAR